MVLDNICINPDSIRYQILLMNRYFSAEGTNYLGL